MEPGIKFAQRETSGKRDQSALNRWRYEPRRGLSIPSVTVLDSAGHVIEDEQRSVFRFIAQEGSGADIIFGVGTTGEWNRIANSERQRN